MLAVFRWVMKYMGFANYLLSSIFCINRELCWANRLPGINRKPRGRKGLDILREEKGK